MVDFAGWSMPVLYTSILEEHKAVREKVGIFDISHMGELEIKGAGARDFLSYLVPSDISKMEEGGVQYSALLNDKGGIIDDLLIYMIAPNRYFLCVNAVNTRQDFEWISGQAVGFTDVEVADISRDYGMLSIQGPNAESLMGLIVSYPLSKLGYYQFVTTTIDETNILLSRTGYTGENGFEFFVSWRDTPLMWERIMSRGKSLGLKPIGLGARDTLRLEMRYPLHGHDMNEDTTPYEAGLGWIVKLNNGDFLGKEALVRQKEEGVKRKLVGVEIVDKGIAREGYAIMKHGKKVGVVTSGTLSPTLNKGIALGYVPTEFSLVGTTLGIDIRGKEAEAVVVKTPFVAPKVRKQNAPEKAILAEDR
jgi:aminomethyltransferase